MVNAKLALAKKRD